MNAPRTCPKCGEAKDWGGEFRECEECDPIGVSNAALEIECADCGARPGQECIRRAPETHRVRIEDAVRSATPPEGVKT